MFYEKISAEKINDMTTENNFTPIFTYEDFIEVYDEESGILVDEYYVNLTIHKTAEEVYNEWINKSIQTNEEIVEREVILGEFVDNEGVQTIVDSINNATKITAHIIYNQQVIEVEVNALDKFVDGEIVFDTPRISCAVTFSEKTITIVSTHQLIKLVAVYK